MSRTSENPKRLIKLSIDDDNYKYLHSLKTGRMSEIVRDAIKLYRSMNLNKQDQAGNVENEGKA